MKKVPFVTLEKLQEVTSQFPTPFHLYDEKGIRENAKAVKEAFAWNKGFKEYFAVKATPNPFLIRILQEYGCGCDCSSMTELMMSKAIGCKEGDVMFSSNDTPDEEFKYANEIGGSLLLCYENAFVNRIPLKILLQKKRNYIYKNGVNKDSKLVFVTVENGEPSILVRTVRKNNEYLKMYPMAKIK